MNCLVTGGAGFVGSHVCERLLSLGHAVCALDDLNDFYSPAQKRSNLEDLSRSGGRFTFVEADVTDRARMETVFGSARFDQVIHLAARPGVRPSLLDPALYMRVNAEGTAHVIEAARRNGVRKLVLASSSSVYGARMEGPFRETDAVGAVLSPYAASKLASEALAHAAHRAHGMDVAVLRFFTVYGPRQRPDLAIHKFARLMDAGKAIPVFGDGTMGRDYTYVSDVVDAVEAAAGREFGFEIINVGDSRTVTLSEVVGLLEAALGRKAVINRQPELAGDVPRTLASLEKARWLLGYEPKVRIEDGIRRFVEWFRQLK